MTDARARILSIAAAAILAAAPARAQAPAPVVTVPPVSLILPNYNSVPVGEVAALEGGAFVARANDTSAGFYNPAGLALAEQSAISGTSGAFQFGSVSPESLDNVRGTFQQIPAMFGVVINNFLGHSSWAGGLTVTRSAAWDQQVDSESVRTTSSGANRLRLSTEASYDAWLGSLGVGYARSDRLRLGATIDGQYTSASRRQSVTAQQIVPAALSAVTSTTLGGVDAMHLRATVGAQVQVAPAVFLGAVMRTAGLGIFSSGDASLEALMHAGTVTATTAFFDPSVSAEYRLPFEFKTGAAWIGARAQLEADLLIYPGAGRYNAVESGEPVTVVVDPGTGGPLTVERAAYVGARVDSRTTVNVALGGRYQLTRDRSWTLHGGYATDRSPVGAEDTASSKVHLQHLTVGLSGRTSVFLGSLGIRYSTGRSDPIGLGPTADGRDFETRFKVSSFGIVYSLALLF